LEKTINGRQPGKKTDRQGDNLGKKQLTGDNPEKKQTDKETTLEKNN
jgi:hypothetical protein